MELNPRETPRAQINVKTKTKEEEWYGTAMNLQEKKSDDDRVQFGYVQLVWIR